VINSETTSPENNERTGGPPVSKIRWTRLIVKVLGLILLALTLLCIMGWSSLAIYFSGLHGESPRGIVTLIFVVVVVACLLFIRPRRYGVLACFGLFVIVLIWFFSLRPSNDREWAPDNAAIPSAEINGDRLIIHNVRNFDYRSETDFTPRWEDRTYDLSKLRTVDCMFVTWGSPAIAHVMVSFGFEGDQYLAVSIEARKQKDESYSAIQGFFRQFELIYIFSDERDVVRVRTNYRIPHEQVQLYRTSLSPKQARELLNSYLGQANALNQEPQFYNALTTNCATSVLNDARAGKLPVQMSWRVLLSGYAPQQMYWNHRIDTSLPFEELVARSHINAAAMKADQDPEFSKKIRIGLPMPVQVDGPAEPNNIAATSRQP
jgi:hypothetical protein